MSQVGERLTIIVSKEMIGWWDYNESGERLMGLLWVRWEVDGILMSQVGERLTIIVSKEMIGWWDYRE
jgi:hypothetical protein